MKNESKKATKIPSEVQLAIRSMGQKHVTYYVTDGVTANRWLRKLNRANRRSSFTRFDHVEVKGTFVPTVSLEEAKRTMLVAQATTHLKRIHEEKEVEYSERSHTAKLRRESAARGRLSTQYMSFHGDRLEQTAIVFCPVTGLIGQLELPFCPVAFEYTHPLAKAGNVLTLVKHFQKTGWKGAERQLLAGCVLSLLSAKKLLREEVTESTASERNLVLQNAGSDTLITLLNYVTSLWDNPIVWKRLPKLNVEWKTHASSHSTVAQTVQSYIKLIKTLFDPLSFDANEVPRIVSYGSSVKTRVKVYSAAAVQVRQIKEARTEANELFEGLKSHLTVVEKLLLSRVLKDLLLLPDNVKASAASKLREAQLRLEAKGVPQAELARKLASVIETAKNEKVFENLGTLSQEVLKKPYKTIAEIIAAKKAKQEDSNNGN